MEKKWTITYKTENEVILVLNVDTLKEAVEPLKKVCPLIKSCRTLEGIIHKKENSYRNFIKIVQNFKKKEKDRKSKK